MVSIGLVTERLTKERKCIFEGCRKKVIYSDKNPFQLIVAEIPFDSERVASMKDKVLMRRVKKAEKLLKENGVEDIVLSDNIKSSLVDWEEFENNSQWKRDIFLHTVPHAVRWFAPLCGIDLMDAMVCIRDSKMDRISEYLMRELCYDTKSLVICTQNEKGGAALSEQFCDETGMPIKICKNISYGAVDVLIDVDNSFVRIGRDMLVDSIKLDFDLGGYEADSLEIASYIKDFNPVDRVTEYFSNKKS